MRILYLVGKYPIKGEPKQGKYPLIMDGMLQRGHQIVMLAFNAPHRGSPWLNWQTVRNKMMINQSLVIEVSVAEFMRKLLAIFLRRFVNNGKLVKSFHNAAFRKGLNALNGAYKERELPEVIHVYGSQGFIGIRIGIEFAKNHQIPVVWNLHSHEAYLYLQKQLAPPNQFEAYFKQIKKFLPVSDPLGHAWESLLGKEIVGKWISVPNPTDPSVFQLGQSKQLPYRIVHVSTLDRNKNIHGLLKAVDIVAEDFPVEFQIIGNKGLYPEAEAVLKQMKHPHSVKLLGRRSRDEVAEILQGSHLYVQASEHETYGNPVVEAMFCGLPTIVTKSGGPESLVPDFGGFVLDQFSEASFAELILKVLKNIENYDSQAIRTYALQRFSPDAVFEQLEDIYKEVIYR